MTEDSSDAISGLRGKLDGMQGRLDSLQGKVDGMQGRLDRVQGRADALQGKADKAESQADDLRKDVRRLSEAVKQHDQQLTDIARNVADLGTRFDQFASDVRRDQEMRAARDELADLRRQLAADFGAHQEVRKFARNLIRNVDDGTLDVRVMLEEAQRRSLDVPDYWLSQASLAFLRWASGDRERYAASIRRALMADQVKTALFMALILRPYAPGEAIRQWIALHLSSLKPLDLPPEFGVIVDGVTRGVFGTDSAWPLFHQISEWYRRETRSRGAEPLALAQWRKRLSDMGEPADQGAYPVLSRDPGTWEALSGRHQASTAFEAASGYFPDRFAAGVATPADLSEQVAAVLSSLGETPVAAEAASQREVRRLAEFIRSGDRAAADQLIKSEEAAGASSQNILTLIPKAAFPDRADGAAPAPTVTELLAIWVSAHLITRAADRLGTDSPCPQEVTVLAGPALAGKARRTVTFSWPADASASAEDFNPQVAACRKSVRGDIAGEAERQRGRWRLATRASQVALPTGVVLGGVAAIPTGVPMLDFIAPAVVLAVPSLTWLGLLPGKRKRLNAERDEQARLAEKDIQDAGQELKRLFEQERGGQEQLARLRDFLRTLGPADIERAVRDTSSAASPRPRRPGGFPAWTPEPPGQPFAPAGPAPDEADDRDDL